MTLRKALAKIQIDATTNLSSALELLPNLPDDSSDKTNASYLSEARAHSHRALTKIKVPAEYTNAFEQREARLRSLPNTTLWEMHCTGRFVVGLGDASVRETGLRLLRPWGLPLVPGSALKGVAAKAAHTRGGPWAGPRSPGEPAGEYHRALFGDVDRRGKVIFHDAWWIPANGDELPVALDTMTPHHGAYYSGSAPPLDSDSPNPVPFLSAYGTYLLALTGPRGWADLALELLREALEIDGLGAKTATGYGRFKVEREHLSREEQKRRELRRKLKDLPARDTGAGTHGATAQELLDARAILGDEETLTFAREVIAQHPSSWKKWLDSDARTEDERWLRAALTPQRTKASSQNAAPTTPQQKWATGTARKQTKKKKGKTKTFIVFEGHLEGDPTTKIEDSRRPKDIEGSDALGDDCTPVRARVVLKGTQ